MRFNYNIQSRLFVLSAIAASALSGVNAGLRGTSTTTRRMSSASTAEPSSTSTAEPTSSTTAPSSNDDTVPSTLGYNFHYALSEEDFDLYPGAGQIRTLDPHALSNNTAFGLGYLEIFPGGIRELHWHPFSTEWGYITEGTCVFTLMDNDGNYDNGWATVGDIWNFPKSYVHSIQAVDETVGCKMVLFFDAPYRPTINDISVSEIMSGQVFPEDVIEESIGAPASVVSTFYKSGVNLSPGTLPAPARAVSTSPLSESPIFHIEDGTCANSGGGGYLFMARNDVFPGATSMSGGLMHLEQGTLRDIHWHPNANEIHYVTSGTIKVGIYAINGVSSSYTLNAGDVGFVPQGMAHYFEPVDGPADVLLAFDDPFWTTQELSSMFAVTPSYITAGSLNTTTDVVDEYFPKTAEEFINSDTDGPSACEMARTRRLEQRRNNDLSRF